MKTEGSLPRLKEPSIGPHPGHILEPYFFDFHFDIILH
jgi:hypothetical protein